MDDNIRLVIGTQATYTHDGRGVVFDASVPLGGISYMEFAKINGVELADAQSYAGRGFPAYQATVRWGKAFRGEEIAPHVILKMMRLIARKIGNAPQFTLEANDELAATYITATKRVLRRQKRQPSLAKRHLHRKHKTRAAR